MSADNGWCDPERPGVPLNPERDGWHWLQFRGRSAPYHWTTAQAPRNGVWHIPPDWEVMPEDRAITNQRYFGPCLTLADVAAREAAARDAGADYTLKALAARVGVTTWEGGDGTETWEGDVSVEVANILRAAGVWDDETIATHAREAAAAEAMRGASADKVRDKAVQLANAGAVTLSEEWHEVSVVIRALPLPAPDALARAIQAAVAAEREACAEIVAFWPAGITTAAQEQIAAAIRARKDQP